MILEVLMTVLAMLANISRLQSIGDLDSGSIQRCGNPVIKPVESHKRIVGGVEAAPHSWPWQVGLQKNESGNFTHWCGGSIISPDVVLTAAHCFIMTRLEVLNRDQYMIIAGDHNQTTDKDGPTQVRRIKKIIIHEKYNPFVEPRPNDLALLILQEPLVFNANISAACLPKENITKGENCYAVGWGNTRGTGARTLLNQARIPMYDFGTCKNFPDYDNLIESMICAWNIGGGVSICGGDSGSAYSCLGDDGFWYLQGVTVWSSCTPDYPVLMQRVYSQLKWIQAETGMKVYSPVSQTILSTTTNSYAQHLNFYNFILLFMFLNLCFV